MYKQNKLIRTWRRIGESTHHCTTQPITLYTFNQQVEIIIWCDFSYFLQIFGIRLGMSNNNWFILQKWEIMNIKNNCDVSGIICSFMMLNCDVKNLYFGVFSVNQCPRNFGASR